MVLTRPVPVADMWRVDAELFNVFAVLGELVTHGLFQVRGTGGQLGYAVDDIHHQVIAVEVVAHRHIKRRGGGALFLVATHMQVLGIVASITEAMN